MRLKLIAVAGIGLLAGACSLNPTGMSAAYSSLPPSATSADEPAVPSSHARAVARTAGFGPVMPAASPMPGDLIGPIGESRKGHTDPVASLNASAQARSRWVTLRPGDLTRPPLLQSRLIQALAGIGRTDVQTGSVSAAAAAPKTMDAPARAPRGDLYDREAAMQRLLDSGRFVSSKICEGC